MITPRFTCSQTDESITISVYCPSIRAADVEIDVDEALVSLYANPYYLRLNFSHPLVEDGDSSAKYDLSSGYLSISLTKKTKGQEFKDLDLLTKLLAPRKTKPEPIIEVLSSQDNEEEELVSNIGHLSLEHNEILEAAENDWQLLQPLPEGSLPLEKSLQKYYGFLDGHSGYFRHVTHTENEINELGSDAETCPPEERRRRRVQHENEKWDEEYYIADYADDDYIQGLIQWTHPHIITTKEVEYTEEENLVMMRLPRKEYLTTPIQTHYLYLTLVTLLFSFTYESRTTQHDPTPESAWTVCSLTPAFSALDPPSPRLPLCSTQVTNPNTFSLEELGATLVPSYRRALAFPLYRSFALADICRADVSSILLKGKKTVVRCLLEMKDILDHHEVYYIYSKVWVDDFCSWIQTCASDETLDQLGVLLGRSRVEKAVIGWRLEELEVAAREGVDRETDSDDE